MKKFIIKLIIILLLCAISWLITCGIIYLISLCFGFEFSWLIATGIWLVMVLIKSLVPSKE